MAEHNLYMRRCLELAANGLGLVYPNPMVGSVIVYKGLIIGEGWHQKAGEAHAEVNAINAVKEKELLSKATLYVNLEPCSHYGKTPPCADLIIKNNIKKVVIGSIDTNDKVGGKGIKRLKENSIEVIHSVMEKECRELNKRFFTFHEKNRPFVILKWARSKDGYIFPDKAKAASGTPFWISNKYSLQRVHQLRSQEASILVGKNTVLQDDPKLNLRHFEGNGLMRLVIDRNLELPDDKNLFDQSVHTIIYNEKKDEVMHNLHYVKLDFEKEVIAQIMNHLYHLEIQSVIVEGGAYTLAHFIESGFWDEALVFEGDQIFKEGIKGPDIGVKPFVHQKVLNDDMYLYKNNS
ncbi:bifunctional diaminohydroxyphosphoribosylaminopyrimidine deaminase/5-amino-6-(5-phosphoribosylamino)uracil reductase RibD [Lutimonas halocynthiae]|uniref:bifunctional diaminohydroxyphosphoribosylaminopyrimidine deaminase/5-amino-6-(5-phosphoribosylamino)uracil reductase RibD n=1 Tax=Lutimonas halocynthiae TaxID=1446477 RepID=UPI0025B2D979|nr:bifunctional diaminohydroxyphosphoribosylaminopyrimidine deaminase/5-amino-6-(5-phosphoribosylamino)uracil reductase RibD [Lutimonas halocynthiae]MDN3644543.1 bifunctional diaminohydroxyphosphoribosylaminopyrimidine deaminase/5-amino-6-(5-phosphoribosylamino)uracil reductase RibD [Lutimonas halocynthiae]